jgi:hypothetical protein
LTCAVRSRKPFKIVGFDSSRSCGGRGLGSAAVIMAAGLALHRAVVVRGVFDTFIAPIATWQAPRSTPAPQPATAIKSTRPNRDWEDAAGDGDWQTAVLGYLRERRREAVPYWTVINAVVLASVPSDRWEVRFATTRALQAVKALIRDRRVLRYRRRFLAVLDVGAEVVPLAVYRSIRNRTVARV